MPNNKTIKMITAITALIVASGGGTGFGVYKWQEAELKELRQTNSAQDLLAGKEGHRLLNLEEKMMNVKDGVKTLTDSVGSMNVTINRMDAKLETLLEGYNGG